jgi:adenine/guanine/hypoxanthine permease
MSKIKLLKKISNFFEFSKHKTNFKTEIIAGVSIFMALSYIFIVNPAILSEGGFNASSVLFATIITSFIATLVMGLWAKKPFVLAPGMEMNAYVSFFVIGVLGFTWQQSLGAVFWSGIIFIILTITNIRTKIIKAIPDKIKSGLSLAVGVFLILIALRLVGILLYEGITLSKIGILISPIALIFYVGLILVLILRKFKIPGAVLISIILASVITHIIGLGESSLNIQISKEMFTGIFQADLSVILNPKMWSAILILFLVDFYGSIAKFIGLTRNTSIVDKDGNMPKMKEALSVDGYATLLGSGLGTTSLTTYVESGVGIAEGGRTGFTAIVCSLLMLGFLVLAPLISLVPVIATTGALFWVGIRLFPSKQEIKEYTKIDIITVIVMVITTIVTFAIDRALLFGFLIFIIGTLIAKKKEKISVYMIGSTILLLIGLIFSIL